MWTIDTARFAALRVGRGFLRDAFAKRIGLGTSTLRRWETGTPPVRAYPESVRAAAKALGCEPTDFATPATGLRQAPAERAEENPLRRPSSLGALAREEDPTEGGEIPQLSAAWLRSLFSAYRAHDGRRFRARCTLEDERGLPPKEAEALGCDVGVGVKVRARVERTKGPPLEVTVFATGVAQTLVLQAALRARTSCEVVLALRALDAPLLWTWESATPRPWALVVV